MLVISKPSSSYIVTWLDQGSKNRVKRPLYVATAALPAKMGGWKGWCRLLEQACKVQRHGPTIWKGKNRSTLSSWSGITPVASSMCHPESWPPKTNQKLWSIAAFEPVQIKAGQVTGLIRSHVLCSYLSNFFRTSWLWVVYGDPLVVGWIPCLQFTAAWLGPVRSRDAVKILQRWSWAHGFHGHSEDDDGGSEASEGRRDAGIFFLGAIR